MPDIIERVSSGIQSVGEWARNTWDNVRGAVSEGREMLGDVVDAVAKHAPDIVSTTLAALATPSFRGTLGNYATYTMPITLRAKFLRPVPENLVDSGRPLCERLTLSSCTGFTLCENPQVDFSCLEPEEQMIKSFLSGGFYIE